MRRVFEVALIFFVGSALGWMIELFFRRFISRENKERKWINPGFLCGPYLPIYGFGLCVLYYFSKMDAFRAFSGFFGKLLLVFIMAAAMTAIEFLAGIIFIKLLKVDLWDYSDMPGNVLGVICPQFSLYWAVASALYYVFVSSIFKNFAQAVTRRAGLAVILVAFYAIFAVDLAYSCHLLSHVRRFAREHGIVVKYEVLREIVASKREEKQKRRRFFASMISDVPLSEHLKSYLDWVSFHVKVAAESVRENGRRE